MPNIPTARQLATAPLETISFDSPLSCLQHILTAFDLRPVCDTPFQFGARTTLIAVWGPGFRRDRHGEEVLRILKRLFSLLEFARPRTKEHCEDQSDPAVCGEIAALQNSFYQLRSGLMSNVDLSVF